MKIIFVKHVHAAAKSPGGWLAFIAFFLIAGAFGAFLKVLLVFAVVAYLWFLITNPAATLLLTLGAFIVGMVKKIPDTYVVACIAAWCAWWLFTKMRKSKKAIQTPENSALQIDDRNSDAQ